jgi:hypothetical protein
MIAKLVKNPDPRKVDELLARLTQMGVKGQPIQGGETTVIAIIGDTTKVDLDVLHAQDIIEDVTRIQEPYKLACRKIHPADTVVTVGGTAKIGGDNFAMIAGPCSVESREQLCTIAESVKTSPPCRMRWPIASIWSFSPSARPGRPRPELSPVGGRAFSRSFTTCLRASPWSLGPPQPMRSTSPFASRVSVFMSKSWYLSDELPELTTNTFLICFFIFTA